MFRVFVFANVCRCVLMTDTMGYIANLINPVLQVRKAESPVCVCVWFLFCFVFYSLPVIIWSYRSVLLYRTTVPFQGTFANLLSPNILWMCCNTIT